MLQALFPLTIAFISLTGAPGLLSSEGLVLTDGAASDNQAVVRPESQAAAGYGLCPLTGLPGAPELTRRTPLGVMVENTRPARPHSGLDEAEVVFEVHVEGGVTRFMGLFVCHDTEIIGPVRSTRQVFAEWAHGLGAYLSHAWAKPTGYEVIRRYRVMNIDGVRLAGARSPFFRSDARKKPHNLYTSTKQLRRYAEDRGYEERPLDAPLFTFKDPAPAATPTHPWIGLDFNGLTYFAHFVYDGETNRYQRHIAGRRHESGSTRAARPAADVLNGAAHSRESNRALAVENLLVLFMRERVVAEGGVLLVETVGEGPAVLFRDGLRVDGRWRRSDVATFYRFETEDGAPLEFNRGRTWVGVLPSPNKLVFDVPTAYARSIAGPE